ncbi:MAG TPA: tRNA (adenosine(37)-N6)-threonylcarbamoyltransferase complex ATPase subunit type 1 TsaE [Anaerolineae bacterium]|nr:tRNA (adenosine(37)-N6)-threonylcarbamoyltransferase complex ATPase subunit type 1 TsaE [Anaerolineae bacterium]
MNPTITRTLEIISESVEQTQALGARLGTLARSGDVIALQGELGAGKTNFVQGLARGLGITEDVNSPTFILANEYLSGRLPLYHIDVYRIENAEEAEGFGLDDYLNGEGVTVIEWADRIRDALPHDVLWIELEYVDEQQRRICITPLGTRANTLLDELSDAAGA